MEDFTFCAFFDQEPQLSAKPQIMLASIDNSEPYEVDEHAIFLLENGKFCYISISGCSCWPTRGYTEVWEANSIGEIEKYLEEGSGTYSRALSWPGYKDLISEAKRRL